MMSSFSAATAANHVFSEQISITQSAGSTQSGKFRDRGTNHVAKSDERSPLVANIQRPLNVAVYILHEGPLPPPAHCYGVIIQVENDGESCSIYTTKTQASCKELPRSRPSHCARKKAATECGGLHRYFKVQVTVPQPQRLASYPITSTLEY